MGKKEKSPTCSQKGWCTNHVFEMSPRQPSLYFRKPTKYKFCPKKNRISKKFVRTMPQVNKDKKFYTPSFILQQQQSFYVFNDDEMKRSHNQRAKDLGQGLTKTIMVANHVRKRKYCSVCGRQYDDYLNHISSDKHKQNIKNNKFTLFIKQLQNKYNKKQQKIVIKQQPIDITTDHIEKIKPKQSEPIKFMFQNSGKEEIIILDDDEVNNQ